MKARIIEGMTQNQKSARYRTVLWVVGAVVVGTGVGAAIGAALGLIGMGAGTGLAIGAVVGFIFGVPAEKH